MYLDEYVGDASEQPEDDEEEEVTFEEFIETFKTMLLVMLKGQYKEYMSDEFIEERVAQLFPDSNFYCYKMKDKTEDMAFEWAQIEQLVVDGLNSPSLFIKSGQFEPQHSTITERDILISGIETTMNDCFQEINNSLAVFKEKTDMPSKVLLTHKENIERLAKNFLRQAREKPWVF